MASRKAVKIFLVLALGLPILLAVFDWVITLLSAMGDNAAANFLEQTYTFASVLWLVSVVGLVITLAIESLDHGHEPGEE